MANTDQVRSYVAHWLQLGKRVCLPHAGVCLSPVPIYQEGDYSPQFEQLWCTVFSPEGQDAYLEGTLETIADLLTDRWEISPCARCSVPMPVVRLGVANLICPCHDLPSWPNTELPQPRLPVDSQQHLEELQLSLVSREQAELRP